MKTGENIRLRSDGRYEARYIKRRNNDGKIQYGYCYGKTREEAIEKREWQLNKLGRIKNGPRLMNLLILGAGSHGREVFEIAESLRCFAMISFLDDNKQSPGVIGKCSDITKFMDDYCMAIPAVGSGDLRQKWTQNIIDAGFVIPTLIDPTASVSKSAVIGYGTVIGAMAAINSGAIIGNGCIISSGAVVGRGASMSDWGFLNSGETIVKEGINKDEGV